MTTGDRLTVGWVGVIALLFVLSWAGARQTYYEDLGPYVPARRIGAVCRDGSTSAATESGACSWHGGVSEWRYSEGRGGTREIRPTFLAQHQDRLQSAGVLALLSMWFGAWLLRR